MKKSVTTNYIYNLIFQMLIVLFPIITTPYLARVLGAEQIGVFGYTLSIITYFVLLSSLGISLYGQRETAYVQDDIDERSKIFNNLFFLRLITTIVSTIFFLTFIIFSKEYKLFYLLWIIELVANLFDISWFYQGLEQFKRIIFRNLIIKVFSTFLIFIFIKNQNDLYKYIIIYSGTTLFGNLSLWTYLPKLINFKIFCKDNFLNFKTHLKALLVFFIPQLATKIYTVLDKSMIGIIVKNKNEVGYYEQSQKIVYLLLTIITSLGIVMMPRVANLFAKGKKDEISNSINNSIRYVFFIGFPLMAGAFLTSQFLIPLYLGNGYEKSIILMQALAPVIIFVGLSNVTGIQLLIPLKRQKEYNISVISGALINLLLNIFLIKEFGGIGAAVATVISELAILCIQMYFVKDIVNFFVVLKRSVNYLFSSLIMVIILNFVTNFLNLSNLLMLIVITLTGFISYFSILLILKDELLLFLMGKLKKTLKLEKIIPSKKMLKQSK